METPKTRAGELTELIMSFFWAGNEPPVKLETAEYNRLYSHILRVLSNSLGEDFSTPEPAPRLNREQRRHARFVEKKPGW